MIFFINVLQSSDLALEIAESASFFVSMTLSQFLCTSEGNGHGVYDSMDLVSGSTRVSFLFVDGVGGVDADDLKRYRKLNEEKSGELAWELSLSLEGPDFLVPFPRMLVCNLSLPTAKIF